MASWRKHSREDDVGDLVSPGGGALANLARPGGRALANPRDSPEKFVDVFKGMFS